MTEWIGSATLPPDDRVGVLVAPSDLSLVRRSLEPSGLDLHRMTLEELIGAIDRSDCAMAVLSDSVLPEDLRPLREALDAQPPWSDFPLILLVDRADGDRSLDLSEMLGFVALVVRPIDEALLRNATSAALRSRRRQREARAFLHQRESAEERLRQMTLTLEMRVKARMTEIKAANERLVQEITERRDAEERLRESEELYRLTVELGQQLVWTADASGKLLSISHRYQELTGLSPGSLPREAVHPDDREPMFATWKSNLKAGQPHLVEYRLRMRDGSYRRFRAQAAPRRDETGRIVKWYGTTQDIHDQTEAQRALAEAEERFRLAARATNDVIWDLDPTQGVIHWSDSATHFFGYPAMEPTTSIIWWEERVHPDDRDEAAESLRKAMEGDASRWAADYRFQTGTGDYADVLDRGFIIRDGDGRAVRAVGAMTDITERRRAEAEIQRMQSELIHVSRLTAMGTMAATLAHELNQPLTAVASYLRGSRRLLETAHGEGVARAAEALERAEAGALRAGLIVRRLREMVSRGTVAVRTEDLPRLIREAEVLGFVDEQLRGVSHRLVLDPRAQWVEVDGIQIQQVLINLIRNAIEAMHEAPVREVVISTAAVSGERVQVSVADSGPGLISEHRGALFSPVESAKAEGMGIGLSISRTIIEAHGGKIWAEDGAGGGAVFRFTIPRAHSRS